MHTIHCDQHTVDEVVHEIPEAGHVLREHAIDVADHNHHLSLEQAAQATSNWTDEVLAIMEYRARRAAQQTQ
jgi:iron-sulfur cluster repair protein YtfE (RIC family)